MIKLYNKHNTENAAQAERLNKLWNQHVKDHRLQPYTAQYSRAFIEFNEQHRNS